MLLTRQEQKMKSESYGLLSTPLIAAALMIGSGLLMLTLWAGYLAISGLLEWLW